MKAIKQLGKNINLRLAEESDSQFIVDLRQQKGKFLSLSSPSVNDQKEWIKKYKERERQGNEYYFIIESKSGEGFGVVRLYDFKVDSFCWGSWIIKNNSPSSFAIESAILVYEFGFDQLGFKQSHFDVRKGNKSVWNFHEKFGAIKTGENDIEYFYKINQDQFFNAKKKYKKFRMISKDIKAIIKI